MFATLIDRRHRAISLCLLAFLLAIVGCGGNSATPRAQPRSVAVITLAPETVALDAELAGRTVASEQSEVRPQVGGILLKRMFEEGAAVHVGQPLFQIDPTLYQAAVNQAQAELASSEAALLTAQLSAQRYQQLGKTQLAAQQDVDDAIASHRQALAARDASRAALDTARTQLRFTTVTAPISGRIGRALVLPGALVTASQDGAIAKIQRLDPMHVDITQSSSQFLQMRRAIASGGVQPSSTQVSLKLSDGSDYPLPGTLEFTDIDVEETTGSVILRARFPNPDGQLLPGMYVRAIVGQGVSGQALLVPQVAVDRTPRGEAQVWVVDGEDVVHLRQFSTLRAVGDRWLVGEGLQAGDRVVVEGRRGLNDGAKVSVRAISATSTQD
jgi:membrane fusion protein (multidrug efflux system)